MLATKCLHVKQMRAISCSHKCGEPALGYVKHVPFTQPQLGTGAFMALAPSQRPRCLFAVRAGLVILSLHLLVHLAVRCWYTALLWLLCEQLTAACADPWPEPCLEGFPKVQNPTYKWNSAGFAAHLLTKTITL